MSNITEQWPKWICTRCKKVISNQPFGRCHDCQGIFREATSDDLLCDRCEETDGLRLLDRTGDYDRLCEGCIHDLDLRTTRSVDTDTDRSESDQ